MEVEEFFNFLLHFTFLSSVLLREDPFEKRLSWSFVLVLETVATQRDDARPGQLS